MFTRFKNNTTTLFIDPNFEGELPYKSGTKVNIILSPSLYWVKKISLPISSLREVKKLLPSIFEESLPEAHYSYTAYKSGNEFMIFAYEDKKIFEILKKFDINYTDILSLHFAQSELDSLDGACRINASESIYLQNGVVVLAPTSWLKESKTLDLNEIILSKHKIKLQQYGHIVDSSSLYKIGAILVTLVLILLVELFVAKSKLSSLESSKEELFSKYKLQATMFQNRASMKKYSKIHKTQTQLREYISYFLGMKLKNGQKILLIELKNHHFYVTISGVAKGKERYIISQLDSKGTKYKISFNGDTMRVEMQL